MAKEIHLFWVGGISSGWFETPPTHNPPTPHNIYYCIKNQVHGLCVGGDMTILLWNEPKIKWPYLRLRTTHTLDFWYSNRYCDDLSPYQKSDGWVVCRRSFNSTETLTQFLLYFQFYCKSLLKYYLKLLFFPKKNAFFKNPISNDFFKKGVFC